MLLSVLFLSLFAFTILRDLEFLSICLICCWTGVPTFSLLSYYVYDASELELYKIITL